MAKWTLPDMLTRAEADRQTREAAIAQEARMSDDLVKQKKVTEGEVCPEASSLVKWVVETELAKHIEELEDKLAKAVARSDKLAYWLDIDQELWDAFTVMKKSDHRHMQSKVQAIKDILTGGKDE